jgi:hypothetical protein
MPKSIKSSPPANSVTIAKAIAKSSSKIVNGRKFLPRIKTFSDLKKNRGLFQHPAQVHATHALKRRAKRNILKQVQQLLDEMPCVALSLKNQPLLRIK